MFKGKKLSKEHIGKSPCRHHIDVNPQNNNPTNILILTRQSHRKLHARTYDFVVEKGVVEEYIKWFIDKYGIK